MSAVAVLGRNDQCPCGSGKKVKRCHGELAGKRVESYEIIEMVEDHQRAIESFEGYMPPPDGSDGWSLANFRETGCPYGSCTHETEGTRCAAGCGI